MNLFKKDVDIFNKRIHEIDFFRGVLIILVVFDHFMWFMNYYIFHYQSSFLTWYWNSDLRFVVRQIVLIAFLFTCGVSCYLSRNNKKRGSILLALAVLVTIATHVLQLLPMFNSRVIAIDINILGVIALSILLFTIFEKFNTKNLMLVTSGLMIFYFFIVVSVRLFPVSEYYPFKTILFNSFDPVKEGYIADYLPLFPYVIALFFGVIFARNFYKERKSLISKRGNWEKPICFLGRHTLIIYIAHEVIFTIIFMLIGLAF